MEIICISCWRAFDHDTSTAAEQVTCPHCGFQQPGPDPKSLDAKLDANTRPSEVASPPDTDQQDAEATSPELVTPAPQPSITETTEYEAAPAPPPAPKPATAPPAPEAATPAPEPSQPEAPDHRWRLRTPSMLVLFFPDYEGMSRYLTGDEGDGFAVACGPGPFRTLSAFNVAMRVTDDPLEALVNVPPAEGEGDQHVEATPRPRSGGRQATKTGQPGKPQIETPPSRPVRTPEDRPASSRARSRRRRVTATADFTFRKAQNQNVWPGRLLFLLIGLLAGGAAVYYIAWIGLLPGIVY